MAKLMLDDATDPKTVFDDAIDEMRRLPGGEEAYQGKVRRIELAKIFRSWRRIAGITQTVLAKRMRTSQSVIARLESFDNDNFPSIETVALFAKGCGRHLVIGITDEEVDVGAHSDSIAPNTTLVALS